MIFSQNLKYAFRALRRSPAFATVSVLSLALGIAINSSVFSAFQSELYPSFGYKDLGGIYEVQSVNRERLTLQGMSVLDFLDLQEQVNVFDDLAAIQFDAFTLTPPKEDAIRAIGMRVTPNFFSFLGTTPLIGRDFYSDDQSTRDTTVVLDYDFWHNHFGGDPTVVGRSIVISGQNYAVIGVMSPRFRWLFSREIAFYVPLRFRSVPTSAEARKTRELNIILTRLKPGATLAAAQVVMQAITPRLQQQHPEEDRNWVFRIVTLGERIYREGDRRSFVLLQISVALILLIACVNVISLLLVRAVARKKEMALRWALGAQLTHILRQLLSESFVLSGIAMVLALPMTYWGARLIASLRDIGPAEGLSLTVFAFTSAIAIASAMIVGLAPVLHLSRHDLNVALKGTVRGPERLASTFRNALVIAEISIAVLLVAGAGLLFKTLLIRARLDPGFDTRSLLVARLPLLDLKYARPDARALFLQQVLPSIAALPGVRSVTAVNWPPLRETDTSMATTRDGFTAADLNYRNVTESYFRTLRIPVLQGRDFEPSDITRHANVAIVNAILARKFWPNQNPIGKQVKLGGPTSQWLEIVGVVTPTVNRDLTDVNQPEVYQLTDAPSESPWLIVRTAVDPLTIVPSLRHVISSVDRNQPLAGGEALTTMEQLVEHDAFVSRFLRNQLFAAALFAIVLAGGGIYTAVSYFHAQRIPEIGIRMALGANRGQIFCTVSGYGIKLGILGCVFGMVTGFCIRGIIMKYLYGVSVEDPTVLIGTGIGILALVLLASFVPAYHASQLQPASVLRTE